MAECVKAACVQLCSGSDVDANLALAAAGIRAAAAQGAKLIVLPENVDLIAANREQLFAKALPEARHPALPLFRDLARETGAWIVAGSLSLALDVGLSQATGGARLVKRSYLLAPSGTVAAAYDKIHMFDADLGAGETYRESETYQPGARAVAAATPWGGLGLTICYDLRFPHLFRNLAQAGARFIALPAAFTVPTGQAHWHVLLRARAIETGSYILAAGQCGQHSDAKRTYGHSLIVGPWGEILAEADAQPAVITATLDPAAVDAARHRIPSLRHDRAFERAEVL